MTERRWVLAALVLFSACKGGDDTEAPTGPDIRGRYNVIVAGTNGCLTEEGESRAMLITTWANGALAIDGDRGGALTYDFGNGTVFQGSADDDSSFQAGGGVTEVDGWTLDAFLLGSAASADGRWVLTGDFSVRADDDGVASNDCTIEGPFQAFQVAS